MTLARLDSAESLAAHIEALVARDGRLHAVREAAGPVEVRKRDPGFAGLARVICGQQLSIQSAAAIWTRFAALEGATVPRTYLGLGEDAVRAVGLSAAKYASIRAVAEAVVDGRLDLGALETLPAVEAVEMLCRIKGIGPWTAEIYLLFCLGHPDVFPVGDLALQKAVAHALGLPERPLGKVLAAIAEAWSPHRGAAALLFWRYHAAHRLSTGAPL